MRLQLDVEHLATAIHAIGRIDTVRTVKRPVLAVFGELRQFKLDGTAPLAATLLGLFAFWLGHK